MPSTIEDVRSFWNSHPCGAQNAPDKEGEAYFRKVEEFRYTLEPHILEVVPFADGKDKDVLEIGCGLGTDGAQWARAGARYTGVDLTPEAVRQTSENFRIRGLSGTFLNVNAEELPFATASFDLVYSHGVIHHAPDIEKVLSEIHRVLRPGGKAIIMVYHRSSYNYYVNILLLRRLGALLLLFPGGVQLASWLTGEQRETLAKHREAFQKIGWRYLRAEEFLNANTDGPENPLSRVYSKQEAAELFKSFKIERLDIRYLNRRRIPWIGQHLPEAWHAWLSARWGWHLYVKALK